MKTSFSKSPYQTRLFRKKANNAATDGSEPSSTLHPQVTGKKGRKKDVVLEKSNVDPINENVVRKIQKKKKKKKEILSLPVVSQEPADVSKFLETNYQFCTKVSIPTVNDEPKSLLASSVSISIPTYDQNFGKSESEVIQDSKIATKNTTGSIETVFVDEGKLSYAVKTDSVCVDKTMQSYEVQTDFVMHNNDKKLEVPSGLDDDEASSSDSTLPTDIINYKPMVRVNQLKLTNKEIIIPPVTTCLKKMEDVVIYEQTGSDQTSKNKNITTKETDYENEAETIEDSDDNREEPEVFVYKTTYAHPVFLQEPYHSEGLYLSLTNIQDLSGPYWISTRLVDYLLKWGIPPKKEKDIIIPTSAITSILDIYFRKSTSDAPDEKKWLEEKMQELKYFAEGSYKFIICSCSKAHFFVITLDFDADDIDGKIFRNVTIYDSIKRSVRSNDYKINNKSEAGQFLKRFQKFLLLYVLHESEMAKNLLTDNEFILQKGNYKLCPQQENTHDCGLFAFAIVLHLVRGQEITEKTFTQSNIAFFRKALYLVLNATPGPKMPDPTKVLSRKFLISFFDNIYEESVKPDPFLEYLHLHTNKKIGHPINLYVNNELEDLEDSQEFEELYGSNLSSNNDIDHEVDSDNNDDNQGTQTYPDVVFQRYFEENNYGFKNFEELFNCICEYQEESKIRLKIDKSQPHRDYYLYLCGQHTGCNFRASFGKYRGKIILKNRYLQHIGQPRGEFAKDGRKLKSQKKGKFQQSVDTISRVKHGPPSALDVVKAARNIQGEQPTYNDGWRSLQIAKQEERATLEECFQQIVPYLEVFQKLNAGTIIDYQHKADNSLDRFFLCPGIMNNKLKLVRPVMSLDAAHMMSANNGTLYIATVKSSNNELIPVAITITAENENLNGWRYFLTHLKASCKVLVSPHTNERCRPYKRFTFISDRDKGLETSMKEIFPENHHTYCQVHIKRNVKKHFGPKAADIVQKIGETFSSRQEGYWLYKLKEKNPAAYEYIEAIDPKTWRPTTWMQLTNLPPRYGIKSSNDAEAVNKLFLEARKLNWFESLDMMLDIIITRNCTMREKYKNDQGIIVSVQQKINKWFQEAATYSVLQIEANIYSFKVTNTNDATDGHRRSSHIVNSIMKTCSCGEWQDNDFPCIHAVSYYRNHCNYSAQQIVEETTSYLYTYVYLRKLYKDNIHPVIIDNLTRDYVTRPANRIARRSPGRPKVICIKS